MIEETALGCVVGRFPKREEVINDLFRTDQTFRSLCEDYCECLKSLARWTGESGEKALFYQRDYQELLAELTTEIMKYADRSRKHA